MELRERFSLNLRKGESANSKNGIIGRNAPLKADKVIKLPVDKIVPNPNQARLVIDLEDPEFIRLVNSIKYEKLQNPIHVIPNKKDKVFELRSGERRLTAYKYLGYKEIEAIILDDKFKAALNAISTNEFQKKIHIINKGQEVQSVLDAAKESGIPFTIKDVANYFGKSPSTIYEWLGYLAIGVELRGLIEKLNIRDKGFLRQTTAICKRYKRDKSLSDEQKKEGLNKEVRELITDFEEAQKRKQEKKELKKAGKKVKGLPEKRIVLYYQDSTSSFESSEAWKKHNKREMKKLEKKLVAMLEEVRAEISL
ncbi:ParB/RepB/Spo0J family partition protein [Halobacteriovorax sp. CON-3]|uniref:ParB/RepB/Spo0J family partition protein n=1 Tax=Halobacteriovorax sp. CON-3 TaxID=3157710 RepID=UPI00371ED4DB